MSNGDCADLLRKYERIRDASDKVRGFIYQDLLAVEIILNSKEDEKVYVEWVEDIYVEGSNDITVYQVKHYASNSTLNINSIYDDMLFQYLKYGVLTKNQKKKSFNTNALYYAKKTDYSSKPSISYINPVSDAKIKSVFEEIEKKMNVKERVNLLIRELGETELANGFIFNMIERKFISEERKNVITAIKTFVREQKMNMTILGGKAEEVLLSVALQYIQKTYYSKSEDSSQRALTLNGLSKLFTEILVESEISKSKRITYRVLAYIDEVFQDIYDEIEGKETLKDEKNEILEFYREVYHSTKHYFEKSLLDRIFQFKFLNTVSNDKLSSLNYEAYMNEEYSNKSKFDNYEAFLEHKEVIISFVRSVWKILFNIKCNEFEHFIIPNENYLAFKFDGEEVERALVSCSSGGSPVKAATNILSRMIETRNKPEKWYLTSYKGVFNYDIDITKIREAKLNEEYSIVGHRQSCFAIECLKCVECDYEEMDKIDDTMFRLFELDCYERKD